MCADGIEEEIYDDAGFWRLIGRGCEVDEVFLEVFDVQRAKDVANVESCGCGMESGADDAIFSVCF